MQARVEQERLAAQQQQRLADDRGLRQRPRADEQPEFRPSGRPNEGA